jgi:hypothetical protein
VKKSQKRRTLISAMTSMTRKKRSGATPRIGRMRMTRQKTSEMKAPLIWSSSMKRFVHVLPIVNE